MVMTKNKTTKTKNRKPSAKLTRKKNCNEIIVSEKMLTPELEMIKKEKTKFRIRSKKLFLTYPKLPTIGGLDDAFLESLRESFGVKSDDTWGYLLAEEKHADGTPHIHVYLEFKSVQGIYSVSYTHLRAHET